MSAHLIVSQEHKDILEMLVKEHEFDSQKEFTEMMILYFKETGINPKAKNRSTAEELSKLRNTIISFIRKQEEKKLDPILMKVTDVMEFLKEYFKNEAVSKSDISALIQHKERPKEVPEPIKAKVETTIDTEKNNNVKAYVKGIFNDFYKQLKSSAFGGYTVEKAVAERYKSIFDKL